MNNSDTPVAVAVSTMVNSDGISSVKQLSGGSGFSHGSGYTFPGCRWFSKSEILNIQISLLKKIILHLKILISTFQFLKTEIGSLG